MSNISYLIPALKMMFGDIDGTKYSNDVYEQALVAGGRFLSKPLGNKYIVSAADIVRNTTFTFDSDTPYIESEDELGFLLAALLILHSIPMLGAGAYISWSTPDLSLNQISVGKTYLDLYKNAKEQLEEYLKTRLGRSQKTFLPNKYGLYPYYRENIVEDA